MSHHPRQRKLSTRPLMAVVVACLLAVLVAVPASAVDITTTGNGSWQVPAGVTSIAIECWGGGGGGGGDNNSTLTGGGGGGGGAYAKVNAFAVTPGQNLNYFVGAGGSASINGGNGGAGGNTTFNGTTCVAVGGSGGIDGSSTGAGGNGGTAAASTGNIKYDGGKGAPGGGSGFNAYGGGGGGSAGTGSNGNIGNGMNGAGAVADGGAGGDGALSDNGSNAPAPGPGGGGGGGEYFPTGGSRTRNGGMGYAGKIRIRYNATLTMTNPSVTYNGSPQGTTVTSAVAGTVSNIKYGGSPTMPTNAGTYEVTADFAPTDAVNYSTLIGAVVGNFTINKAATTTEVTCSIGPFTYTGSAITPSCTAAATGPAGLNQTGLPVSFTDNINAGIAAANASYAGDTNYSASNGSTTFTIAKASSTTTVTCDPGPFVYKNGPFNPCSATLTGAGGLTGNPEVGYSNNINAGTATASAGYPGDANHEASNDSENFAIDKATPVLSVETPSVTYTGSAQQANVVGSAAVVGLVDGTASNVKYNGSDTAPADAGTYPITADFTPVDVANYNSVSGAAAGDFTIGKASSTTAIDCGVGLFPYTGLAQEPCTATATGVGGFTEVLTAVYTDNTNAGTAGAGASFAGNTNFAASSNSTTFTIGKAASTTTVTCTGGPFVYKNGPFNPCSATLTGAGGLTGNPEVGYSNNINAGTATASAGYPGDANHEASNDSENFAIDKATPVLSVETPSVTYTGSAQQANVVGSAAVVGPVDGTASNVKYNGSDTAPADAGTYPITADFTPVDVANYNSVSGAAAGDFTIGKASSTTAIDCGVGSFPYTGLAQEPCTATATGVGGFTEVLTAVYTDNTNAGTAGAGASFAGNTNFTASTNSTTFTIAKATSTTTVTCDSGPFVYKNGPFTPCTATLTGAGGLTGSPEVSYSSNVDAGTATASAGYPGDANHEASSDSKNFTIDKATPTLLVDNTPVTYNGSAQQASVKASGPAGIVNGAASNVKYNGSDTAPADAGTYPITADFTPVDVANYNSVSGAAAGDFVIDKAATVTTVSCGAGPFVYQNVPFTPCTAIVTGPPNLNDAVTVTYANNTAAGTASASASYTGDANHQPSNGTETFTIDKATPTLSVENPSVTYNGGPQLANVIGSVAGASSSIKYDGLDTAPTNAGIYAITADFAPTDAGNYNSLSGATAGTFTIAKANPTISLNNPLVDYDGTPKTAEVIGSVAGTPSNVKYNGSDVAPSNAGTYAITADFAPTNGTNHNSLVGASAGNFVIQKAGSPVLSVDNPSVTFDGQPHAAVVVGSVPGTPSNVLYNGSPTVPVDAGTYVITADYTPDNINYTPVSGESAGTLVIAKAGTTTTVTCGTGPFTYNGTAFTPCAATVTGPGNLNDVVPVSYSNNVNAGTASANADYAGSANYLPSSDGKTFPIAKANPGLTVFNSPVTYNGAAQTADVRGSVGGSVSNIRYNGSATAPINAGTYAITADFAPTDAGNYNTLNSGGAGNFVIQKAGTPVLTVNNPTVTFDGAPHAATVVGSVAGTPSNIKYNGSATVPTDAGTYIITADYTPTDTTNYDGVTGVSAGSFTIAKAATATTVTCEAGPFTYTGAGITPCTAGVTGPGGLTLAVTVTYVGNVNTGTATANAAYAGGPNYLPSSGAATFTIDKAATTTTIDCGAGPFTYTGSAIEPCAASATGPGGLNHTVAVVYADNTSAGTASASGSFEGSANYLPSSGAATFTIGKAATTTAVVCQAGPFTYNGTAFTPCAASVTGPGGLSEMAAVSYSSNTNAGTASASASFAGGANYLASSGTATFTIDKAATTTVITCDPGPFSVTGSPVEPCTARVTGPAGLNDELAVSYSNNVNAGTATASASYAGGADYLPSSDSEVFVIGEAVDSTVFLHLPYMSK